MKIDIDFIHYGEIRIQFDIIEKLYNLYRKFKRCRKPLKPTAFLTEKEIQEANNKWKEKMIDNYFSNSPLFEINNMKAHLMELVEYSRKIQ